MLEMLLFMVVVFTAPLLAMVVFVARLRDAVRRGGARALAIGTRSSWRNGVRRPVWPLLIAAAAGASLLTVGLERLYLATVTSGPGRGFDVALFGLVLAVFGSIGCAALAGAAAAAVARARGFGAGTVAGLLGLFAIAGGTAAAHLPLRAAYIADPGSFPVVPNLGEGGLLIPFDGFLGLLISALPWPLLAAALASTALASTETASTETAGRETVRDVWQLLLDLATADLPDSRSAWGTALRAELAAINPPAERRRFALGGVWTALRSGWPRGVWLQAAGVALAVAGGSFAASRWSLAHDQGGILAFWTAFPTLLIFAVTLGTAWRTRSFSSGLRTALAAGFAAMVAALAIGIPEAMLWASERAGYVTTGDATPPTWQAAVLDVLRPEFLVGLVAFWTMGALSGAALGKALARLRGHTTPEVTAASIH